MVQFTKNPLPENWTGLKRILRYLKGTMDFALTYEEQGVELETRAQPVCWWNKPTPQVDRWLCVHNHRESCFDHGVLCNRVTMTWPTPKVISVSHCHSATLLDLVWPCMTVLYIRLVRSTVGVCGESSNHYGGTAVTTVTSHYHYHYHLGS